MEEIIKQLEKEKAECAEKMSRIQDAINALDGIGIKEIVPIQIDKKILKMTRKGIPGDKKSSKVTRSNRKCIWTDEIFRFIKDNLELSNPELIKEIKRKFGMRVTYSALCSQMSLKGISRKKKLPAANAKRKDFTSDEVREKIKMKRERIERIKEKNNAADNTRKNIEKIAKPKSNVDEIESELIDFIETNWQRFKGSKIITQINNRFGIGFNPEKYRDFCMKQRIGKFKEMPEDQTDEDYDDIEFAEED